MEKAPLITCPKCSEVLRRTDVVDVAVDLCSGCGGIWLDKGELGELRDKAGFWDLAEVMHNESQAKRVVPPSSKRVELNCPSCDGKLSSLQVSERLIDVCLACQGLWLDKGELDQTLAAIGPDAKSSVIAAILGMWK